MIESTIKYLLTESLKMRMYYSINDYIPETSPDGQPIDILLIDQMPGEALVVVRSKTFEENREVFNDIQKATGEDFCRWVNYDLELSISAGMGSPFLQEIKHREYEVFRKSLITCAARR